MRRIIANEGMSLDGVIQSAGSDDKGYPSKPVSHAAEWFSVSSKETARGNDVVVDTATATAFRDRSRDDARAVLCLRQTNEP